MINSLPFTFYSFIGPTRPKHLKETAHRLEISPPSAAVSDEFGLTHPDLAEAALSKFEVEAEGLSWNLPGVPGQPLCLRFGHGTHVCESVAESIRVL